MDRDGVEVHKLAKKERGQYPAILTEQTWSIKDLFYGFRRNFSCGTRRVVPSGQDSYILPARVANHSTGFDISCMPAHGASHIIIGGKGNLTRSSLIIFKRPGLIIFFEEISENKTFPILFY